ncbi:D-alanyl-D-alanine carboxypeptidase/D-alanyl-D-alanine-endopeptidase [Schaalia canis]|nr:D-alanyl-D-alanine carboxypeptidase/D-alanyl-D-alanine-endopeptidase [Schaalia canis]
MRRRTIAAIVCLSFILLGIGAYLVASFYRPFASADTELGPISATEAPDLEPQSQPSLHSGQVRQGQEVSAAQVEEAFADIAQLDSEQSWSAWAHVVDAQTGQTLLDEGAQQLHTPASVTKILTAYTAYTHLDENARLATGTSLHGTDLFLWGQGDILLARGEGNPNAVNGHAGVADLAAATLAALKDREIDTVTLRWQGNPFEGPSHLAAWDTQEVGNYEGHVAAFAIDAGRVGVESNAFRSDPEMDVALELAAHLRNGGVEAIVTAEGDAPEGAQEIARVESATLGQQIRLMLHESDNTLADQHCRLAAQAAGVEPSYSGATANITNTMLSAGVEVAGMKLEDCSGLSANDRIAPEAMTGALMKAMNSERADLRDLVRALPWGAWQGTMKRRYEGNEAAGNVQAKTGSLSQVTSLAGIVRTSTGRELVFAVGLDGTADGESYFLRSHIDSFIERLSALS